MKNEKVIFVNIDEKKLNKIERNVKYVLITSKDYYDIDLTKFDIKPLVMCFNGTLGIDLENNKTIINETINKDELKLITKYFDTHNILYKKYGIKNNIYTVKFVSKNFSRMLIIPAFFQSKYKKIKTLYSYPKKKKEHYNYLVSTNISYISNLGNIINYLGITTKNIVDLEVLSTNILDNLNNMGYCIGLTRNKSFVIEMKGKNL